MPTSAHELFRRLLFRRHCYGGAVMAAGWHLPMASTAIANRQVNLMACRHITPIDRFKIFGVIYNRRCR